MQDDDKDKIDHLRDLLYSPNSPDKINAHRRKLGTPEYSIQQDWQKEGVDDENAAIASSPLLAQKKGRNLHLLVFFSFFFFVVCAGIVAYVYLTGFNSVSAEKIALTFNAPISTPSGEPLSVNMSITNNNSESLLLSDVIITYPDGSRQSQDVALPLVQDLLSIGTIAPGQTALRTFEFTPFGDENTLKDVQVTLQYHIANSNAIFEKKKTYEVSLSSPPVSITVNALKEINSNQQYDLTVHLVSNSLTTLKNLLVSVKYPFGFTYKGSTPSPVSSSSVNIWNIGNLEPGGQRDIAIKGVIVGGDADQRVFGISLGIADNENPQKIGTVFLTKAQTVNVSQPFLASSLVLDGDSSSTHAVTIGRDVSGRIVWKNNLQTAINDVNLVLKLSGDFINKSKIYSSNGYYDSETNSIIWNKLTNPDLRQLAAGSSGQVSFDFSTISDNDEIDATEINPTANLALNVSGTRLSESNVPQSITASDNKTVKVSSNLGFAAKTLYSIGPFKNVGPVPPKVGTQTTYTINWSLKNSFNDLGNVSVKATLPIYVTWLNAISPSDEKFSYNPNTHVIVWNVGNVSHGTGFGTKVPREVSFQVGISPSLSQRGSSPVLVNGMTAAGTDLFTNEVLTKTIQALNTTLFADPAYTSGTNSVTE